MRSHDIEISVGNNLFQMRQAGVDNFSGVYALFDSLGKCLYAGKSRQILTRLMSHWRKHWGLKGKRVWVACGGDFKHDNRTPIAPDDGVIRIWKTDDVLSEAKLIDGLCPTNNKRCC